jgi:tricorn protease
MRRRAVLSLLALLAGTALPAAGQVNARLFRQPDVSATQIVFVYAGDLWLVPKTGGEARRLTTPAGEESFPRFSPDGSMIAYTASYDGNPEVYVVPTAGGVPARVTWHPMPDRLVDWFPDGRSLMVATSMTSGRQRYSELYRVSASGSGLPVKLSIPYGEFAALSPDGRQAVYMPQSTDFRTWKRYRGGWAPDLWLFDLTTFAAENLTQFVGNDAQPMWAGRRLYFLSDRDAAQRNNLWVMELDGRQTRQLTRFTDFDITFPAIGPQEIVFQAGGRLYLLDLRTEQQREVPVTATTDLATLLPRQVAVQGLISYGALSANGNRAVLEARGELFSLPARYGPVLNLTQTSGAAERFPEFSPDGRWLAFWSDRTGEYELYVRPAAGPGVDRKVTEYGPGFRYRPYWSPDSRRIAFVDETMTIRIVEVENGRTVNVDKALNWMHGPLQNFAPSWSADSRWLAYGRDLPNARSAIFLFDTRAGRAIQVTSGYYDDTEPAFDPDGKYLFFLSNRTLRPVYGDQDNSWVYANSTNIVAVALRPDVPSPLAPRDDRDSVRRDSAQAAATTPAPAPAARGRTQQRPAADTARPRTATAAPVEIDTAGFERRLVVLPPAAGNYTDLAAVSGKVLYRRFPVAGTAGSPVTPLAYYDLKEREEKTVLGDVDGYALSGDGKKVLLVNNRQFAIVDLKADAKMEHTLRIAEMEMTVVPREEWRQIFNDVWRLQRDYFYDRALHGVDWAAMRQRYGQLLGDAVTRWDVNFVIGELISELNASHTYRGGGDEESAPSRAIGLLGVDWAIANGAYRIARIVDGAPWDNEARSPLAAPGVNVRVGDYVLAVNGVPLDTMRAPWAAFVGLAGRAVELTVHDRPTLDGARRVVVETLRDETRMRHLEWIEANRRRVEEASGGRVGYVYVPSTGVDGQTELVRQFMAQFRKDALIIDERFNSGGQIPDRFIELLNRPPLVGFATRHGQPWQWPPVAHYGPKVMLINGWSGSGGDAFPNYFRLARLGPLVGMRTWGGLIGISGVPALIDGGNVTVPTFRQFQPDGTWFPEGHGVEPDVPVVDDPSQLARGVDPQLERGIQEALRLLQERPYAAPRVPAPEVRVPR